MKPKNKMSLSISPLYQPPLHLSLSLFPLWVDLSWIYLLLSSRPHATYHYLGLQTPLHGLALTVSPVSSCTTLPFWKALATWLLCWPLGTPFLSTLNASAVALCLEWFPQALHLLERKQIGQMTMVTIWTHILFVFFSPMKYNVRPLTSHIPSIPPVSGIWQVLEKSL